jgi:hypothetical protein
MKKNAEFFYDVPCFRCAFWKSERENQLLCKPAECEELTVWLTSLMEESCSVQVVTYETTKKKTKTQAAAPV